MTNPEQVCKQVLQFAEQGQAATADMVRALSESWAGALRTATGVGSSAMPAPAEVTDRSFDFTVQMIEAQRAYAHRLLAAGAPVAQAVEQVTDSVADRARQTGSRTGGAPERPAP